MRYYYLIDFGLSRRYDSPGGPVPTEFQNSDKPRDPFVTDIPPHPPLPRMTIRKDFVDVGSVHC